MNWRAVAAKGGRPNPRVSCTLTAIGGKLFMVGGAAHEKPLNDVRVLDLEGDSWTVPTVSGTPPPALVGHSATLIGTELFIFGGSDGKRDGNELHIFDTETLSWAMPSLEGRAPNARVGHTGCAVGSTKIYYFGGYGIRLGYVNDTHILDTALLSWSRPYINGAPPSPRVGHAGVVIGLKMYIIGGASNGVVLADLHVLDTRSMSWASAALSWPRPPSPLHCTLACRVCSQRGSARVRRSSRPLAACRPARSSATPLRQSAGAPSSFRTNPGAPSPSEHCAQRARGPSPPHTSACSALSGASSSSAAAPPCRGLAATRRWRGACTRARRSACSTRTR